MTTFKQIKPIALLSALMCAGCLFFAVSASAADSDSMSQDQTTGMQEHKAAEGMAHEDGMEKKGMKNEDSMSGGDSMSGDSGTMSQDDMKKKDSMSGGEGGVSQDESMNKEDNM